MKKKKSKEKTLDIGYLFNCEISTQEGREIHTIHNIKILHYFDYKDLPFSEIENFMKLLSFVNKHLPEGNPIFEVFEGLELLLQKEKKLSEEKIILARLKFYDIFGELGETHGDEIVVKILRFIHAHSMKDVLKLKDIEQGVLEKLKMI